MGLFVQWVKQEPPRLCRQIPPFQWVAPNSPVSARVFVSVRLSVRLGRGGPKLRRRNLRGRSRTLEVKELPKRLYLTIVTPSQKKVQREPKKE